jgi:hypothetical protein
MLKNKPVNCIVLGVAKHGQEPFCVMLVALVFRAVKYVSRSGRIEEVLNGLGQARRSG